MCTMASFDELRKQAVGLGFTGEEVGRYVLQQQAYEREERAAERQAIRRKKRNGRLRRKKPSDRRDLSLLVFKLTQNVHV